MKILMAHIRSRIQPTSYLEILILRYSLVWMIFDAIVLTLTGQQWVLPFKDIWQRPVSGFSSIALALSQLWVPGVVLGCIWAALYVIADRYGVMRRIVSSRAVLINSIVLWLLWFTYCHSFDAMFLFYMVVEVVFIVPFFLAGMMFNESLAMEEEDVRGSLKTTISCVR